MRKDPILEEIWRVRESMARRGGYDVKRIVEAINAEADGVKLQSAPKRAAKASSVVRSPRPTRRKAA